MMSGFTIYLIDDDSDMLDFLRDSIELVGFETKSYTRAADFFENSKYVAVNSILVLDLNMPEMDGIEVMRQLSKMENPPKLILVTGYDVGVLHAAEKLGLAQGLDIIATLTKPIAIDSIHTILEHHASIVTGKQSRAAQRATQDITADELLKGLRENQLVLHYQPQVNLATDSYSGVEALVRWQHPDQGLIFPDRFIPLAEQSGIMDEFTSWVIDTAVEQQQQWRHDGIHVGISVNISAANITSLTLPEQLAGLLVEKHLNPGMLTLEVTESALMGELVTSLDILTRLRLKGIQLSIDDFGTGFSSLSLLHRVPFTELKIDRSFVMNMTKDDQAKAIVKTCIMLGHELDMQVVAEGVESLEQIDLLRELGCDFIQGYFISRPVPHDAMKQLLLE